MRLPRGMGFKGKRTEAPLADQWRNREGMRRLAGTVEDFQRERRRMMKCKLCGQKVIPDENVVIYTNPETGEWEVVDLLDMHEECLDRILESRRAG